MHELYYCDVYTFASVAYDVDDLPSHFSNEFYIRVCSIHCCLKRRAVFNYICIDTTHFTQAFFVLFKIMCVNMLTQNG